MQKEVRLSAFFTNKTSEIILKEFDFQKQVKAVRVEFTPDREKTSSGTYTRALVDSGTLEWIELPSDTVDDGPSGGDGGIEENPLG